MKAASSAAVTIVARSKRTTARVVSAASRESERSRASAEISLVTRDGVCVASRVQTAAGFTSRFIGLLNRRYLEDSEALLLRPGGSIHTFGMRFGIDVLFLDRQMRILKIVRRLQPWRLALAPRKTRSVLEVASGRAATLGLRNGVQLIEQGTRSDEAAAEFAAG